jgi:hypothetical protein
VPISIRDLAQETRDVAVPLGNGVSLTVSYNPHWYTLAIEEELSLLDGAGIHTAAAFCKMATGWDLVDDDGNPVPIEVAAIKRLNIPTRILAAVIDAITEDMRPKERRENGSSRS